MKVFVITICFISIFFCGIKAQTTSFIDNFDDNKLAPGWHPYGTTVSLSESDSILKVKYSRSATSGLWDQFSLDGLNVNVDKHPNFVIDIKSDFDFVISVKPYNTKSAYDWIQTGIVGDNQWHTYTFQFYNTLGSPIRSVYIYIDGGSDILKSGNVAFDNFQLGVVSPDIEFTLLPLVSKAAQNLIHSIIEGNGEGEFPVGSKIKLQSIVNKADTFLAHKDIYSQGFMDSTANELFDSITNVEIMANLSQRPLVDSLATKQTVYLFENLKFLSNKNRTLYGQHNALEMGIGWYDDGTASKSDAALLTGSHPAVNSQDANQISGNAYYSVKNFKNRQEFTYKKGGVNTLCFHMTDPAYGQIYFKDLTIKYNVVTSLLPGGIYNVWYKKQLWHLALYLKSLRGEHGEAIPVIFRPFHEHNGNWFWWGKGNCTIAEYNEIWKYFQSYLRDTLNVHNLIYAISPDAGGFSTKQDYKLIYPGDDYVDVFGMDNYVRTTATSGLTDLSKKLTYIVEYADAANKVAALTEFGDKTKGDIVNCPNFYTSRILAAYKSNSTSNRIAFMASWANAQSTGYYAPYPGHPQASDFQDFYEDSSTLFLNDVPELYDSLLLSFENKPSSGCRMRSYGLGIFKAEIEPWQPGKIAHNINLTINDTTLNLSTVAPFFANSEKSIVLSNETVQTSNSSIQNLTDSVVYIVKAENQTDSSIYTVHTIKKPLETSIKRIEVYQSVAVFPNPCYNNLKIISSQQLWKVEVFNILGNKVLSIVSNTNEFSVRKLASGTYRALIYFDNGYKEECTFIKH